MPERPTHLSTAALPERLARQLRFVRELDRLKGVLRRTALVDRFQALVQNDAAGDGGTWRAHGVSRAAVLRRMAPIEHGAPGLWPAVLDAVARAAAAGHLRDAGAGDAAGA